MSTHTHTHSHTAIFGLKHTENCKLYTKNACSALLVYLEGDFITGTT